MEAMMSHQPFYFYAPDAKQQHPHLQQLAMGYMVQTPVYTRPNSAASQHHAGKAPPTLYSNGPAVMTPVASPRPVAHKPTIMLDTERSGSPLLPSTPPLSSSVSVGSPASIDALQTPMNPMFSGFEGFKETFEVPETLPLDFRCASPPMTPVYIQNAQSQRIYSFGSSSSDLSTLSCPSLSPSPSPYARSVSSEQDVDFCDPRNLTVAVTSAPSLAPELTASHVVEEEITTSSASAPATQQAFYNGLPHGIASFEEYSDLESEDDFVNKLVNLPGEPELKRPRACTGSSVVSLGHGSFIGSEEDLSFDETESFILNSMPSPPSSCADSECHQDCHQDKRMKTSSTTKKAVSSTPVQTSSAAGSGSSESGNDRQSSQAPADGKSSSGSDSSTVHLPPPQSRRGRKQSLTEDPSKTFVCDLCSRRFRRQEHLKRHYRSLHTQDKPFECNECGKKFSRSDNLAQHARTHGSGAIVMDLIDGSSQHFDALAMGHHHHPDSIPMYGNVLYQAAADVAGSASDFSSEDSDGGKKKRKRTD